MGAGTSGGANPKVNKQKAARRAMRMKPSLMASKLICCFIDDPSSINALSLASGSPEPAVSACPEALPRIRCIAKIVRTPKH